MLALLCSVMSVRDSPVQTQNEQIFFRVMTQRVLDKTLICRLVSFKALWSCTETLIWTLNRLAPNKVHYMEKILEGFQQKP